MPGNPFFYGVRQLFADQFQADAEGYLYRKNLKAAAIDVSAAERDAFVAQFNRRLTMLYGAFVAAVLVFLAGVVTWAVRTNPVRIEPPLYVGLGVLVTLFMLGWARAAGAPARALAGRAPAAPELSGDEVRRLAFQRLTWAQLGTSAVIFAFTLFGLSRRFNLLAGWNRLWLVLAGAAFAAVAYRAFQKWRFEQTGLLT